MLTGEGPEEILALLGETALEYVDASASTCYPELLALHAALPDCVIDYSLDLGGQTVRSTDTAAALEKGNAITPEELTEKLDYLPWLEELDIFALNWPEADCLAVMEAHPGLKLIWPVRFIDYVVPSNITCFSSQPRTLFCTTERLMPLFTYCTDLVALDLGHQVLRDLEPIRNLKKLKVLILADSAITDISPLEDLTELEYLELFVNAAITDFTPLEKLTKMVDLNLCYCNQLDNLDFLDNMPNLEMAWFSFGYNRFTPEQQAKVREAHPDCTFMFLPGRESTGDGWRQTDRNVEIRRAFRNWRLVEKFVSWDDVTYQEGAQLSYVGPQLV